MRIAFGHSIGVFAAPLKKSRLFGVISICIFIQCFSISGAFASGLLIVSGDSSIGTPVDGSHPFFNPNNGIWFTNILGAGTTVKIQNGNVGLNGSMDAINDHYNSLGGVTSSLVAANALIDNNLLAGVDLYLNSMPDHDFVVSEYSSIASFLAGGGTLMLTGEHVVFPDENARLNALLAALGSGMSINSDSLGAGFQTTTNILADPLNTGISNFTYAATNSVSGGVALINTIADTTIVAYEAAVPASDVDGDGTPDVSDPCPADPLDQCNTGGSVAGQVAADTGGTVTTPDGNVVIDIDPGDLSEDATLSVTETVSNDPAVDLSISATPAKGQAIAFYTLAPDGQQFQSDVMLTILADLAGVNPNKFDDLDIYRLEDTTMPPDGVPDTFIPLGAVCTVIENPVTVFTGSCVVQIDRFSVYAPIVPLDTDGDGIADLFDVEADNCTLVANGPNDTATAGPSQNNTNTGTPDVYGNMCDADFNDNGVVDSNDASVLFGQFGMDLTNPSFRPDVDMNGNGVIDLNDASRLFSTFGQPPGPSGISPPPSAAPLALSGSSVEGSGIESEGDKSNSKKNNRGGSGNGRGDL
jgi:hypothetical protein